MIDNTDIGNKGMTSLHLMPDSVTRLNLGNCGLTSEGIKLLCEHIETNTSITDLLVWGNKFGDKGAKYIADMLKVNKTLQKMMSRIAALARWGLHISPML